MERKVLIERTQKVQPLVYTESLEDGKGKRLGHLAGVGADLNNATRNGRKYPLDLWKRVMESEDFKEGMETKTLFAENDHPSEESGRIDTSIKEVAAVLTNMEIREDEGIVFVEFDILDTPQGRITKSLVDYGSILGVSSRGLGEEIVRDGETIIDPETYSFYGFDIVVQPAVKTARPTATESVNKKARNVVESFKREIENAKSADEVESIRRIAEQSKLPNMDVINEAIEAKLSSGSNDEDNIYIKKLEAKVADLSEQLSQTKLMLKKVSESVLANDIRAENAESKLKESVKSYRQVTRQLKESNGELDKLRKSNVEATYRIAKNKELTESKNDRFERVLAKSKENESKVKEADDLNKTLQEKLDSANNRLSRTKQTYESKISTLNEKVEKLNNDLDGQFEVNETLRNKINRLNAQVENLKAQLNESEEELTETKLSLENAEQRIVENNNNARRTAEKNSLNESKLRDNANKKIQEKDKQLSMATEKYLENKCAMENINIDDIKSNLPKNYTIEDIDKKVSEIVERRRRFNDFPIAMGQIKTGTVSLSESKNVSSEDLQTLTLLTNFQK